MNRKSIEILPIGVGNGTTAILHGEPSTSFAILINGECAMLVDIGFGVTRSAINLLGKIPNKILITHNHLDHAGELPVVAQLIKKKGERLTVFSAIEVQKKLKTYRLDEIKGSGQEIENLIEWKTLSKDEFISISEGLSVKIKKSLHSEPCYGFVLAYKDEIILSYSADSGFDLDFFTWLAQAPIMVVDGRNTGSIDHASFKEIADFEKSQKSKTIYVVHYGQIKDKPTDLKILEVGNKIKIS
jgi:ribonuclease BN (tRNA processing enzyme)